MARWKEKLRDYDYEIVHKPGRVNANADVLSRNPVPISPPNPISLCADDYEHEIEQRIFSINRLPEVREPESHRGLVKDGQKVDRQGELARPGGSPQGTTGARESFPEELNPGGYHQAVSSYGQEFHLGDLVSSNELRCHHVSSLHADGHKSHLKEFLHLERRVSHLSTPPDELSHRKRNADEMEVITDDDEVEDELIEDLELIKTQQLNVGAITESGLSSGYSLFSLFLRNNHEATPNIDIVPEVSTNLGTVLIELGKNSMSIAKSYEHLDDMYRLPIETHLEELARSLHLNITICTGEVTTTNEEDRPSIIPRVPSEIADKTISKTYNDIIDDIASKLNITLKEARDKIIEAKQKSKAYYNLKSNVRTFSPGDHVYLLKEHKTDKFDDHFTGPYLIKQLIGDRNVEI
uniref:Reverse transcriptase RNase H-like domain-containing protein n=1 Tax=Trichogramma kaykai TaxID=54128 RepID=A0ABD2XIY6_9HYME